MSPMPDLSADIVASSRQDAVRNALWRWVKESVQGISQPAHKKNLVGRLKCVILRDITEDVVFDLGDLQFNV